MTISIKGVFVTICIKDMQHNDTHCKGRICDTQHTRHSAYGTQHVRYSAYDTQHNKAVTMVGAIMLSVAFYLLSC